MSKICTKCNLPKPLTDYHKKSENKSGLGARCKECKSADEKVRYHSNKERESERKKKYRRENKEQHSKVQKKSRDKRKSAALKATHDWDIHKRKTDPIYRYKKLLHGYLTRALSGIYVYKSKSNMKEIVGLTGLELVNHLWDTFEVNYGIPRGWVKRSDVNIDHIIPKCTAKTIEDVKRLNHYTNLQLLLKEDNMVKWKYLPEDKHE